MNISQFCLPADAPAKRFSGIRRPFRIGRWIYATDACICVRIPATIVPKAVERVRVPAANLLFKHFRAARCTEPWPGDEVVEMERDKVGNLVIPLAMRIGNRRVGTGYWLVVSQLGEVRYNPAGGPEDLIQFVAGDLQGLLGPMAGCQAGGGE